MTPAEAVFWRAVQRRADTLAPDLGRALLASFEKLRASIDPAELERLITSASPDRLVSELLDDPTFAKAFREFRQRLQDGVATASEATAKALPGVEFDVLNPKIVAGIAELETRVMSNLKDQIREGVRQAVAAGLEAGQGPAAIAANLRAMLGLAPNQEEAVRNFQAMLEAGDAEALSRALRDRRFDGTIARAFGPDGTGLSADQIKIMVAAYRRRFLAFNAQTNARTAALDAQKLGQRLTYQQAVENHDIDGSRLMKRWATVRDSRVRPAHQIMEGEVVQWDEPFSNGQMIPGETDYNCRCLAIYTTVADPLAARRPGAGDAAA